MFVKCWSWRFLKTEWLKIIQCHSHVLFAQQQGKKGDLPSMKESGASLTFLVCHYSMARQDDQLTLVNWNGLLELTRLSRLSLTN